MNADRRPELFQFFAGYFHEDWAVDAQTTDEVIDTFIATHTQNERVHLADLIDAFTAEVSDDQALEHAVFEELGCYYVPTADAKSARSWLHHVSSKLRAAS
jgi:hypothetical protein